METKSGLAVGSTSQTSWNDSKLKTEAPTGHSPSSCISDAGRREFADAKTLERDSGEFTNWTNTLASHSAFIEPNKKDSRSVASSSDDDDSVNESYVLRRVMSEPIMQVYPFADFISEEEEGVVAMTNYSCIPLHQLAPRDSIVSFDLFDGLGAESFEISQVATNNGVTFESTAVIGAKGLDLEGISSLVQGLTGAGICDANGTNHTSKTMTDCINGHKVDANFELQQQQILPYVLAAQQQQQVLTSAINPCKGDEKKQQHMMPSPTVMKQQQKVTFEHQNQSQDRSASIFLGGDAAIGKLNYLPQSN